MRELGEFWDKTDETASSATLLRRGRVKALLNFKFTSAASSPHANLCLVRLVIPKQASNSFRAYECLGVRMYDEYMCV